LDIFEFILGAVSEYELETQSGIITSFLHGSMELTVFDCIDHVDRLLRIALLRFAQCCRIGTMFEEDAYDADESFAAGDMQRSLVFIVSFI